MTSYKKIDLLKLKLIDEELQYDGEIIYIKTPKIKTSNIDDGCITLEYENEKFKELINYILRLHSGKNVLQESEKILFKVHPNCKFFDSCCQKTQVYNLRDKNTAICILTFSTGVFYVYQYLKLD